MADTMTADTLAPAAELAVLDDHPVTNAEYAAFVAAGGDPDWPAARIRALDAGADTTEGADDDH